MATRQYIGARYVPIFFDGAQGTDWLPNTQYEPLTIVTRNGNSYTSKKLVPASVGEPEYNVEYWAATGNYNAYIGILANQVAALQASVDGVEPLLEGYTNVLTLGCKNDGSEDCSAIINANNDKALYFPAGIYKMDATLNLQHSVKGDGFNRAWKPNHFDGTILNFTMDDGTPAIVYSGDLGERSIDFGNISIQLNPDNTGDAVVLNTANNLFYLHDLHMVGVNGRGIYANPTVISSRYLYTFNVEIWGVYAVPSASSIGIETGAYAVDCRFINTTIQGIHIGMILRGNIATVDNAHMWSSAGSANEAYWGSCVGLDIYAQKVTVNNVFFDTYHVIIHTGVNGMLCSLSNCYAYWDYVSGANAATFFVTSDPNGITHFDNFLIKCGLTTYYIGNRNEMYYEDIIMDNIGNNNTFNFLKSIKCRDNYIFSINLAAESYVEVARVPEWASFLVNYSLWTDLISTTNNTVKYSKINTGLEVFYKKMTDYYKIYIKCPAGSSQVICKALTAGLVDKNRNKFNDNSLQYDILATAEDLTAATLIDTINGT